MAWCLVAQGQLHLYLYTEMCFYISVYEHVTALPVVDMTPPAR